MYEVDGEGGGIVRITLGVASVSVLFLLASGVKWVSEIPC